MGHQFHSVLGPGFDSEVRIEILQRFCNSFISCGISNIAIERAQKACICYTTLKKQIQM